MLILWMFTIIKVERINKPKRKVMGTEWKINSVSHKVWTNPVYLQNNNNSKAREYKILVFLLLHFSKKIISLEVYYKKPRVRLWVSVSDFAKAKWEFSTEGLLLLLPHQTLCQFPCEFLHVGQYPWYFKRMPFRVCF